MLHECAHFLAGAARGSRAGAAHVYVCRWGRDVKVAAAAAGREKFRIELVSLRPLQCCMLWDGGVVLFAREQMFRIVSLYFVAGICTGFLFGFTNSCLFLGYLAVR